MSEDPVSLDELAPDPAYAARPAPAEPGSRPRPSLAGLGKVSARERAYRKLKFRILEGELPPGTTLLESEVAALLSMSRTPIREALIRLEEEELVAIRPRHGVTIRHQSPDDLQEIYEVFSALEVAAARLAAERGLSEAERRDLEELMAAMEAATQEGAIERWSTLDDRFHAAIVAACGNRRLQATLRLYWDQQYRARMAIVPLRPSPRTSDCEHRAIVAAILAQDAATAEALHRAHRLRADRMALALLRGEPMRG
ncbi:GntR family transcriptional regulator [Aurantimonas sp. Leaf443]|uniref:GntR family transcriptional regulator n=1 Tax=Aurantimonas sp. Leaf443 TaxID=1736378 RepID=UPI0006FD0044|nr:GntR family transcriptional regulator [Aurantimonas sp. Leaf443]KQT83395.1 transcriptional regulator [Aurantimonas sp. Leaf443]